MRWWLVSTLVIVACGGNHDHGDDNQMTCPCDAPSQDPFQDAPIIYNDGPPDAPPVMASMQVGASGGTLTTSDGVKLVIPSGALSAMTMITITQVTNNLPNGAMGRVYELKPDGTQFSVPAELTIPYDMQMLGSTAETDLALGYVDAQSQKHGTGWSLINPSAHTVTGYITHFSVWSVFPAPDTGCTVNYACMKQCAGADVPDVCCSASRSTCRSKLTTSFVSYSNCYTTCTGASQMTNFGNSACMANCCTGQGWTVLQKGACYSSSGSQNEADAILSCAAACGSNDHAAFCGPINFTACDWDWQSPSTMGDECGAAVNSQFLRTGLYTVNDQIWGNPPAIHITSGTYNSTSLSVSTSCATAVSATGTMTGTWDGAKFSGNWTFGASQTGTFTVAPNWSQN